MVTLQVCTYKVLTTLGNLQSPAMPSTVTVPGCQEAWAGTLLPAACS